MFFGNGDSSRLDEGTAKTLSHLRRMTETGHLVALNPQQSDIAIKALDFYSQWESAARLARSIRNTGLLVTGLLGLWWLGQGHIVKFIERVSGG